MKVSEVRDLTVEELRLKYEETSKELFNLRVQQATGQLEKPSRLRSLRRDIARMRTVMTEQTKAARV
jgi:large subunit ribosomal protein L29